MHARSGQCVSSTAAAEQYTLYRQKIVFDPCAIPTVTSLDALTESGVFDGVDRPGLQLGTFALCMASDGRYGVSIEAGEAIYEKAAVLFFAALHKQGLSLTIERDGKAPRPQIAVHVEEQITAVEGGRMHGVASPLARASDLPKHLFRPLFVPHCGEADCSQP